MPEKFDGTVLDIKTQKVMAIHCNIRAKNQPAKRFICDIVVTCLCDF